MGRGRDCLHQNLQRKAAAWRTSAGGASLPSVPEGLHSFPLSVNYSQQPQVKLQSSLRASDPGGARLGRGSETDSWRPRGPAAASRSALAPRETLPRTPRPRSRSGATRLSPSPYLVELRRGMGFPDAASMGPPRSPALQTSQPTAAWVVAAAALGALCEKLPASAPLCWSGCFFARLERRQRAGPWRFPPLFREPGELL